MYRIFYSTADKYVLVNMEDKTDFPKGYVTDKKMNVIGDEILVDSYIKFNPYVDDPTEKESVKRFKKIEKSFTRLFDTDSI